MNTSIAICIAAATLGFNFGWQRLPEGGMEYIIQLDPQSLEALRAGQPIESDVPPAAGEVRAYRIIVGTEKLPHDRPAEKPKPPPAEPAKPAKTSPPEPAKPWTAMTLTLFGLFASLGANVFLGWVAVGLRRRCREKIAAGG
jgi:hypothetical protein